MKYLKKIIPVITIVMLILSTNSVNAQKVNNPKGYSIEIPKEFKISTAEKENNKLITVSKYYYDLGGYIYITGFVNSSGKAKFDTVLVPTKPNATRGAGCTGGSYQACAMDCTHRPSELGVLLCTAYCIVICGME